MPLFDSVEDRGLFILSTPLLLSPPLSKLLITGIFGSRFINAELTRSYGDI
jgi:hypothetical protein